MTDVYEHVHDPIARAVIESAADAIVAVDRRHRVTVWNPAAERMFGWSAADMVGRVPPIVPDELKAEHNAVQERLLTRRAGDGGQISIATRRFHRDGRLIDVRIDTSLLKDPDGTLLGWVGVYHPVEDDEIVQHRMTERARLVRRLNDIVADLNAELDLGIVLDRITAALIELTGADAGGFVRIEGDRLRLVSMSGLPERMRGRSAELRPSLVGELLRSGKTVKLATGERRLGDLIWSELPGLHTIALGLSYLQNRPYGALYALFSGRKVGHTELELLELLAGHAGVAVGNAVAYAEVVRQRAHERAVIDSSADGIAVLDHDLVVRHWNPAAHTLTGIPPEEAIGRPLPFDMPPSARC
ncbi:PAS domain-containing protein [Actinomadura madurae]|uniref:PAS domain-containing protein n=1 Tax=Actinomadura madurae TaxID=1993 RepID=UPI003558935C